MNDNYFLNRMCIFVEHVELNYVPHPQYFLTKLFSDDRVIKVINCVERKLKITCREIIIVTCENYKIIL